MPHRTQIVCLHEGKKGRSIDPVFVNAVITALDPSWLRPFKSSKIRTIAKGSRPAVMQATVEELQNCLAMGADVTLVVLADVDDEQDCDTLREKFWNVVQKSGITQQQFEKVVFILPKNRIENWIEFLLKGQTYEDREGPRVNDFDQVRKAAKKLSAICQQQSSANLPASLEWSCRNWRALTARMRP